MVQSKGNLKFNCFASPFFWLPQLRASSSNPAPLHLQSRLLFYDSLLPSQAFVSLDHHLLQLSLQLVPAAPPACDSASPAWPAFRLEQPSQVCCLHCSVTP